MWHRPRDWWIKNLFPGPEPKLSLEKQNADTRSRPHDENMEVGYEQNLLSQTLEGLEEKFLDDIMKLAKEQNDAEDAENIRHRRLVYNSFCFIFSILSAFISLCYLKNQFLPTRNLFHTMFAWFFLSKPKCSSKRKSCPKKMSHPNVLGSVRSPLLGQLQILEYETYGLYLLLFRMAVYMYKLVIYSCHLFLKIGLI